jgi:hypothetical protein
LRRGYLPLFQPFFPLLRGWRLFGNGATLLAKDCVERPKQLLALDTPYCRRD